MERRFHRVIRDLHLYLGLFVSPFVLMFALSAPCLVHSWMPGGAKAAGTTRIARGLPLPENLESLSGRALVEALHPLLQRAGVAGEIGWVQHRVPEHLLVFPVTVPGRARTVTLNIPRREATVEERATGLADAVVTLHKSPGPHLADLRMNWFWMRVWRWLADATVSAILFLLASGVCLWYVARSQRRAGITLLAAGALSFATLVYALSR